jgi:hypothetical protein
MKKIGIKLYRSFIKLYWRFHKVMPFLWFSSFGLVLLLLFTGPDKHYGIDIRKLLGLTVGLLLTLWLGFNGLILLWTIPLKTKSQKFQFNALNVICVVVVFATGVVFTWGFILFAKSIVVSLLGK